MAEPTKLLSADEFAAKRVRFLNNPNSWYIPDDFATAAYAAALTALHEAEQAGDAALARVAELESKNEIHCPGCSFFDSALPPERDALAAALAKLEGELSDSRFVAVKKAHERDALAAELSELRAASRAVLEPVHSTVTDEERLRKLLAQPQGERGKALLAVVELARRKNPHPNSQLGKATAALDGTAS